MKKDIMITSTDSFEGYSIKEYCGFISASTSIGTGLLTEFSASFANFTGGSSSAIENKLENIKEDAIHQLKRKALDRKCNAIVGVHMDIDEISSGQKMMFIMTASGTAVKLENYDYNEDIPNVVYYDDLVNHSDAISLNSELDKIAELYESNNNPETEVFMEVLQKLDNVDPKEIDIEKYLKCIIYFNGISYGLMISILNKLDTNSVFQIFCKILFQDSENNKQRVLNLRSSKNFELILKHIALNTDYNILYNYMEKNNKYFDTIVSYKLLENKKEYFLQTDLECLKKIIELLKTNYYPNKLDSVNMNSKICVCGNVIDSNSDCTCSSKDYINYNTYRKKVNVIKTLNKLIKLLDDHYKNI